MRMVSVAIAGIIVAITAWLGFSVQPLSQSPISYSRIRTDARRVLAEPPAFIGCPQVTYRASTGPPVNGIDPLEEKAIKNVSESLLLADNSDAQRKEPPPPTAQRKEHPQPDAQRKEKPPGNPAPNPGHTDWLNQLLQEFGLAAQRKEGPPKPARPQPPRLTDAQRLDAFMIAQRARGNRFAD